MSNTNKNNTNTWRKDIDNPFTSSDIQCEILQTQSKPAAVKSIFRAANILTCLSQGVYTVTEISHICDLNKTTVHRILQALVDSHLAIYNPLKRQYYLGHSISKIMANPYTTHEFLVTCAYKQMIDLANFTKETVFINILLGLQYINLHEIPSTHDLRVAEVTRKTGMVPAGAASKVLLSQLDKKELNIAILNMDLKFPNGRTISEDALKTELSEIRQKSCAVSCGERISECVCISAPVKNYFLPAALSVVGPKSRLEPGLNDFIRAVKKAARQISENVKKSILA
jgi:IclR family KDG regulon transcriptional repressor